MKKIFVFLFVIAIISCGESENRLNYTYKEYRDNTAIQKEVKGNYSEEEIQAMEKLKAEYFLANKGKEFLAKSVDDIIEEYRKLKKNITEYESSITSIDEVIYELDELEINEGPDPYMKWKVEAENKGGETITGFSLSILLIDDNGDSLRHDIVRFKKELAPGAKEICISEPIRLFRTRDIDRYVLENGSDEIFSATKATIFSIKLPTTQTEYKVGKEDIEIEEEYETITQ